MPSYIEGILLCLLKYKIEYKYITIVKNNDIMEDTKELIEILAEIKTNQQLLLSQMNEQKGANRRFLIVIYGQVKQLLYLSILVSMAVVVYRDSDENTRKAISSTYLNQLIPALVAGYIGKEVILKKAKNDEKVEKGDSTEDS